MKTMKFLTNLYRVPIMFAEEEGASSGSDNDIDINALTSPDGDYEKPTDSESDRKPTEDDKGGGNTKTSGDDKKPSGGSEIELKHEDTWNMLKESGYEVPEDYLKGNFGEGKTEEQVLKEMLSSKEEKPAEGYVKTDEIHPDALALHNALSEGKTLDEFYDSRASGERLLNMEPETFMKEVLKRDEGKTEDNPYGLTDEDIEETIDIMKENGQLKIEVSRRKREEAKRLKEQNQNADREFKKFDKGQKVEFDYEETANFLSEATDKLVDEDLKDTKDIFGIEVSKADLDEFRPKFKALVTPDKETGEAPFTKMFDDNATLFKTLFLVTDGGKRLKSLVSGFKEDYKGRLFDRLGLKPEISSSEGGSSDDETVIDIERLKSPQSDV